MSSTFSNCMNAGLFHFSSVLSGISQNKSIPDLSVWVIMCLNACFFPPGLVTIHGMNGLIIFLPVNKLSNKSSYLIIHFSLKIIIINISNFCLFDARTNVHFLVPHIFFLIVEKILPFLFKIRAISGSECPGFLNLIFRKNLKGSQANGNMKIPEFPYGVHVRSLTSVNSVTVTVPNG